MIEEEAWHWILQQSSNEDLLECGNRNIVPILVAVVVQRAELVPDVQLLDVPDEVILPHLGIQWVTLKHEIIDLGQVVYS